jgi:uncharacterized membrane protein YfcA
MEIQLIIVLIAVCSITYSFEMAFGLAGTVLMLPVLSFFFESKTLVIYSILPQMLVAGIALSKSYRKLDGKKFLSMIILAIFGGLAGGYFFVKIPHELFQTLLSAVIILVGVFLIFSPGFKIGRAGQRILDVLAGFSHSLFGISGPIVMTRLLGTFEDKTRIRNHALLFYFSINIIRGTYYTANGSITPGIWRMFCFSAPVLIPVLFLSDKLHFKMNDTVFKKIVAWIIFLSGVIYFFK